MSGNLGEKAMKQVTDMLWLKKPLMSLLLRFTLVTQRKQGGGIKNGTRSKN